MSLARPMDMESRKAEDILEQASRQTISAPPYLATRVFARVDERRANSLRLRRWQIRASIAAALSVVAVIYAAISYRNNQLNSSSSIHAQVASEVFKAKTNVVTVVAVSVSSAAEAAEIARAEIELPAGVEFSYKQHPEINKQKSVEVAWARGEPQRREFLFLVKSAVSGSRKIRVRFLDHNNRVAAEKVLTIRFSS